MPGAMRKMGVYLGLVEDDDGYADLEPADRSADRGAGRGEYAADPRSARSSEVVRQVARDWPGDYEAGPHRGARSEFDEHSARAEYADVDRSSYRITTLHPRTYNEARTIGESFREGTPVIMNLTEMSDGDAKRLVDFSAGLIFGLRGSIERVTNKVFLLSPANVHVTAEDKARIVEGGFFNQS